MLADGVGGRREPGRTAILYQYGSKAGGNHAHVHRFELGREVEQMMLAAGNKLEMLMQGWRQGEPAGEIQSSLGDLLLGVR